VFRFCAVMSLAVAGACGASPAGILFAPLGSPSITGLAMDAKGNTYVVGSISSASLPVTAGAFQKSYRSAPCPLDIGSVPCPDAFLAKYDPSGSLVYAT
jgi:hypothetical protein